MDCPGAPCDPGPTSGKRFVGINSVICEAKNAPDEDLTADFAATCLNQADVAVACAEPTAVQVVFGLTSGDPLTISDPGAPDGELTSCEIRYDVHIADFSQEGLRLVVEQRATSQGICPELPPGCSGDACLIGTETDTVAFQLCPPDRQSFKGYRAKQSPRAIFEEEPRFEARVVPLADQFETKETTVRRPTALYNPAGKNEPVASNDEHLLCYEIRDVQGQAWFRPRTVRVSDQFGEEDLIIIWPAPPAAHTAQA